MSPAFTIHMNLALFNMRMYSAYAHCASSLFLFPNDVIFNEIWGTRYYVLPTETNETESQITRVDFTNTQTRESLEKTIDKRQHAVTFNYECHTSLLQPLPLRSHWVAHIFVFDFLEFINFPREKWISTSLLCCVQQITRKLWNIKSNFVTYENEYRNLRVLISFLLFWLNGFGFDIREQVTRVKWLKCHCVQPTVHDT